MAHEVPDGGYALPLVNDMRALSHEHERGVVLRQGQLFVHVADGGAVLPRRPCLSAPLRALYLHGAEYPQITFHLLINEARKVSLGLDGCLTHSDSSRIVY